MSTHTITRDVPRAAPADTVQGLGAGPRALSWRSLAPDLAYVTSAFFLTLLGFLVLLPLFVLGLGTLVLWIGLPILSLTLLTATGFARENRELLRRWGSPVAEPAYEHGSRRVIRRLGDPQAWLELLHGTLVALPLRIITFAVPVAWLAGAVGGLTWFLWGVFLPREGSNGPAWLLVEGAGLNLGSNLYLVEAVTMFLSGAVLLVLAPLVTRGCVALDAGVARAMLAGPVSQRWAGGQA